MASADNSAETRRRARDLLRQAQRAQVRGNLDDAIRLYTESIQVHATAEAYTGLGWSHSVRRDYTRAIALCRRAIDLDPEFGNPYNDIGAYLIEQRRLDEAVSWLEAATRARRYGAYHLPHYHLGRVWENKFEFEKAFHHYRLAVRLSPNFKQARRALAELEARRN